MKPRFEGTPLARLEGENGLHDDGMRRALIDALEPGEVPKARYTVSAHIWVEAVLTDRALLLVKGAVRARVVREPFPLQVVRAPEGARSGVRLRTSLGTKTLWGSELDPNGRQLYARARGEAAPVAATPPAPWETAERSRQATTPSSPPPLPREPKGQTQRLTRKERAEARRRAGKKPRKPKLKKASRDWVGFPPSSTVWDMSYRCVKCGRPLTNPNSQRHRVGTDCIKRYGSQARKIPNPAYTAWSARRAKADVDKIAQQAAYDAEHARAMADYAAALDRWQRIRAGEIESPSRR